MEQPTATPIDDLCNLSGRQLTIRKLYRKDDYPEDGFCEIHEFVSQILINALSKITTTAHSQPLEEYANEVNQKFYNPFDLKSLLSMMMMMI